LFLVTYVRHNDDGICMITGICMMTVSVWLLVSVWWQYRSVERKLRQFNIVWTGLTNMMDFIIVLENNLENWRSVNIKNSKKQDNDDGICMITGICMMTVSVWLLVSVWWQYLYDYWYLYDGICYDYWYLYYWYLHDYWLEFYFLNDGLSTRKPNKKTKK
jgi:hypothetical protein